MKRAISLGLVTLALSLGAMGCFDKLVGSREAKPRLSMFIGVDISGSFLRGRYFEDSLNFLAHYIHAHLNGLGGLKVPRTLFVGSIGGSKDGEAKTFYPIQMFQDKSVSQIRRKLKEFFPKNKENPYTDYNAFFEKVAETVRIKKMLLRPISIVLLSDGKPDFAGKDRGNKFRKIRLAPLENLGRNTAIRLLYTDAVTGQNWQTQVPRRRIKVWTQDAVVMSSWKEPQILIPGKPIKQQKKFFAWIKDNVDFSIRAKRVE